ncbi:hypothetical protein EDF61_11318 [Arthrobacter sp. JUb115]|nr:hypothetical protein EDF61_11318 [Arthrobacter sp. JUb115]
MVLAVTASPLCWLCRLSLVEISDPSLVDDQNNQGDDDETHEDRSRQAYEI